ncbi:MAG: ABC transporter ATP-binding protein [Gemmatimonadaceae bacterium]
MLHLDSITKRFGPTLALDGASLRVRAGTVHALLGENGAGKTTLMRVAFGMVAPDAGAVRLADADGAARERRWRSPADAIAAGIGMVHQHFALVPALTVAENVALGAGARDGWRFDRRAWAARVREIGARTGLALDPDAVAGELPVGAQQRLEIVKALARDARLLVLDEPTAVLAPAEAEELLRWLRAFAAEGRAAVLITHKLREALSVANDVTVLRAGRTAAAMPAREATEAALLAALLGEGAREAERAEAVGGRPGEAAGAPPQLQDRAADGGERHRSVAGRTEFVQGGPPGGNDTVRRPTERHHLVAEGDERHRAPPLVRATALTLADTRGVMRVREATFELRAGEIVGIAAVEGAGQHELLRALAGRLAPAAGTLEAPASAAFIPEDRHHDALALDLALVENVALRRAGASRGRMRWGALARTTRGLMAAYDVRASSERAPARTLSGGNQQKLVLARELADDPALVIAENPTRGLDVRASAAVHERLRLARDRGAAVVVYSSDLDEVLAVADRVLVVHGGRVHEAPRDREAVGRLMVGL